MMPADVSLSSADIDLMEMQSSDVEEVAADKARRAFKELGKPVVVEDVSVELAKLHGLPGPFVRFFLKAMGDDALYALTRGDEPRAVVACAVAYFDGEHLFTVRGEVPGRIVPPRGENGFGFDATFMPDGYDTTYAEMSAEDKNTVSHRRRAIELFIKAVQE